METQFFEDGNIATLGVESLPCQKVLTYQLNGIGDLPKVKVKDTLLDAILDSIYSSVFHQVLPIGSVKIKSIQHLNKPMSLAEGSNQSGYQNHLAVKVKETSLSIKRFMKNAEQESMSAADRRLEAFKIKQSFLEINQYFQSHERFVLFINRSLANCAQQFAFCFVHRITHGNINNDALSIEGKWQNNNTSSFHNDFAENSFTSSSLNEQKDVALSLFLRWVCYYNSFNKTQIETSELSQYFYAIYNKYLEYYVVSVLGVSPDELPLNTLARAELTSGLIKLYQHNASELDIAKFITQSLSDITKEGSASYKLLNSAITSENQHYTPSSIITKWAIIGLRKVYFNALFQNNNIRQSLAIFLSKRKLDQVLELSNHYEDCAAWLFEAKDSSVHTVIFSNKKLLIYFVPVTQSYVVEHFDKGHKYSFIDAKELLLYIQTQPKLDFNLPGFLAWRGLIYMLTELLELERGQLA